MNLKGQSAWIVETSCHSELWKSASFDVGETTRYLCELVRQSSSQYGMVNVEISLVLTDDNEIKELNSQYRQKDKPTNVLSFPMMEELSFLPEEAPVILGDIVIAYETMALEARKKNISVAAHFSHLFLHGLLHLLGFDHLDDIEAGIMETHEIELLAAAGISNPYKPDSEALKP